ncbi:hypothetical protein HDV01_001288 [Terramyces sp. JEL0728]|nr:hypothetical protein HDV01_001288 [Terramyces sp. JEL0728]
MTSGILKQALQKFQPLPQHSNGCIVGRGDQVLLSRDDIKNGWTTGFNQTTGRSGNVPLQIFEPPAIAFSIGTSNISIGTIHQNTFSIIEKYENSLDISKKDISIGSNEFPFVRGINLFSDMHPCADEYYSNGIAVGKQNGINYFEANRVNRSCISVFTSLISHLKIEADMHIKNRSTRAVFIIPSVFNYHQKLFYYQAARECGFNEIKFITKPDSIVCSLPVPATPANIVVLSVGSQFTDMSVYQYSSSYKTLVADGKESFGGFQITKILVQFAQSMLKLKGIVVPAGKEAKLVEQCEAAKILLSNSNPASIEFDGCSFKITKPTFELLIRPIAWKFAEFIKSTFAKSNLNLDELSIIYLAGGTSNLSAITNVLSSQFSNVEIRSVDWAESLHGASQFMSWLPGDEILEFKTNQAYGIKTFDKLFTPIIGSNSNLRKNQCTFHPGADNYCKISIYEGKSQDCNSTKNIRIGNVVVDSLPMMCYATLKVVMELSLSNILKVYVMDKLKTIHVEEFNQLEKVSLLNESKDDAHAYAYPSLAEESNLCAGLDSLEEEEIPIVEYIQAIDALKAALDQDVLKSIINSSLSRKILKQNQFFSIFRQIENVELPTSLYDDILSPVQYIVKHHLLANYYRILNEPMPVKNGSVTKSTFWTGLERDLNEIIMTLDSLDVSGEVRDYRKTLVDFCMLIQQSLSVLESVIAIEGSDNQEISQTDLVDALNQLLKHTGNRHLPSTVQSMFTNHILKINKVILKLKAESPKIGMAVDISDVPTLRAHDKLMHLRKDLAGYVQENHGDTLQCVITVHEGSIRPEHNKPLYIYEDYLLKFQLKLDSVDTLGNPDLRAIRKAIIDYCQFHLDEIDAVKSLFLE